MTAIRSASASWLLCCATITLLAASAVPLCGDEPLVAESPLVTVELWVAEVSTTALDGLGVEIDKDFLKRYSNSHSDAFPMPPKLPPEVARNFDQILDAMKAKKTASVIAQPKLTTRSGQPASLDVGLMKMGATPTVLNDGNIRVIFHIELTKLTKPVDPVTKQPAREISRCDSALEIEPGEAVLSAPVIPAVINGKPFTDKVRVIVLRATPVAAQATADIKGTYLEVAPSKTR